MLKLSGKVIPIRDERVIRARRVLRLTTDETLDGNSHARSALLVQTENPPKGFAAYLVPHDTNPRFEYLEDDDSIIKLSEDFGYLANGDVVCLDTNDRRLAVLYRRESSQNSFLVTERCDNYCLMCSQPPKDVDDGWLIDEILEAIPLISPETKEIGFTGGEPTLLGDRLISVLKACKVHLPSTVIHVLSNGRRFSEPAFAEKWASVQHFDMMVGIPVYSDVSTIHDYVVQADGAFDQTIRGILNLKRLGQRVEIRVVIHKQTSGGLARLAEFIARNLLFVDHVALMGLEMMGFTRANLDSLWIDPTEYQAELFEAVSILDAARLRVSIYNHQLCLLDRRLWPFAVRSISDWKNEYFDECDGCSVRAECGGFFSSAKFKRSEKIKAIPMSGSSL
jgi:His-Xaa-Ser system radical SAM maturase HxsC